jgi:transcriptional regulator with XRE-family HTH domain
MCLILPKVEVCVFMEKISFYSRLQEACKSRGTTPTAVVKELGLSTSKITAWGNGSLPKADILKKLAERLGVSVAFFFGDGAVEIGTSIQMNVNEERGQNMSGDTGADGQKNSAVEQRLASIGNFHCQHCGEAIPANAPYMKTYTFTNFCLWDNESITSAEHFEHMDESEYPFPLTIFAFRCNSAVCGRYSIYVTTGVHSSYANGGSSNVKTLFIYPRAFTKPIPKSVPLKIRRNYIEACTVINDSAKSAAVLCRCCLEGMIKDFFGEKLGQHVNRKLSLNSLIKLLQVENIIDANSIKVLNRMRAAGNNAAHFETDTPTIFDVKNVADVQIMIEVIEYLFQEWYIKRERENELYKHLGITIDSAAGKAVKEKQPNQEAVNT